MKKVFFDTETTGFTPGNIGQLSMIIDEDGKITAKNYFFKVDYMSDGAMEACNRDVEFYKNASKGKVFADYKDELLELLSNATLIAHNLNFDENFISTEFWRQNIMFTPANRFNTMTYFRDICKIPKTRGTGFKNPKLCELVKHFSIDEDKVLKYTLQLFGDNEDVGNIGFHDARYDTTAMFVAFNIQQNLLNNKTDWKDTFCK